jgi:hypothetical protein
MHLRLPTNQIKPNVKHRKMVLLKEKFQYKILKLYLLFFTISINYTTNSFFHFLNFFELIMTKSTNKTIGTR